MPKEGLTKVSVHVRPYTIDDFDGLLALQRAAFPSPFPEELLWSKEQIVAHVERFPAGAMVAVLDGDIVGSATSLITHFTGEHHTWAEIADDGFISTHDPTGDSLYGIDLCVSPVVRGRGVAKALYDARKSLVVELGLKRFLAGARVPGYHTVAERMSCEEYVDAVVRGEMNDLVLSFMLKQGLRPVQVIPGYIDDAESLDHAVLVSWENPHTGMAKG